MLQALKVKNVALIEEIGVEFSDGLNILSGETGAGKSIIIDSINFVLGERPGKDFVRTGQNTAVVEAFMVISDRHVVAAIEEMGIEMDEDNALLIYRSQSDSGKSSCKVNGKNVTIGMLKEISTLLIDVHGQHEHQSLLHSTKHIQLLDRFCGGGLDEKKLQLLDLFKKYKETSKSIKAISGDEAERNYKIDMYKFQINEIESAKLKKNEDEVLVERRKLLNNSGKLITAANSALALLYGTDGEVSALDQLSKSMVFAEVISSLDGSQENLAENISSVYAQLDDLVRDFRKYCAGLDHDPNELEEIEERLDLIYRLKKKYGTSVAEMLEYHRDTKSKLDLILNSGEELEKLNAQKKRLEKEISVICADMSELRKNSALNIQNQIEDVLKDLGMVNARFSIDIQRKNEFTPNGFDKIEFLISPNKGEPLKPLSKIASGGEMSRVMLALKTALSDYDSIDTFIFDEIDTGVSGRTAQQVAEKLSLIAKAHQILCITHLPQIAAMGDSNFLIEKKSVDERTFTNIYKLDFSKTISELARLIGGAEITQVTLNAAEEMKRMALGIKQK